MVRNEFRNGNIEHVPSFQTIEPAFPGCDHCIVFCSDDGYMPLTSVAIQSIADHASIGQFYDILVVHGGISSDHVDIYERHWRNYNNIKVRLVDVSSLFDGFSLYTENRENFTREAYFRLITPWVLSSDYRKALYLDGDMILRRDIAPIFNIALDEKLIGAVKDYWGICNCYMEHDPRREYRIGIGLTDIDHYVISATLLFNLPLWRKRFSLNEVIRLCASKKWRQHDQDVINVLCQGNTVFLSPTWGMMEDYGNNHFLPRYMLQELEENGSDPNVVHFGGLRKPYQKNYVMYDLEFWRCANRTPYLSDLLNRIRSDEYRKYLIYTIDRAGIEQVPSNAGTEIYYRGIPLGMANLGHQKYKVLRIHNGILHMECAVGYFCLEDTDTVTIEAIVNGKYVTASEVHSETIRNRQLAEVYRGFVASFDIPLPRFQGRIAGSKHKKKIYIRLSAKINEENTPLSAIVFQKYAELSGKYRNDYYAHEGWIIQRDSKDEGVSVRLAAAGDVFRKECRLLWEVFRVKGIVGSKKAVLLRLLSDICRPFVRKPIWLISDRMDRADDNGEVFYRYLKDYHKEDINAYFLLRPDSQDYSRMKELGNIVTPYSWHHKLLALLAEWSISSQTDIIYRDPFRDYGHPYRDILRKTRFVFLQHGVISNDLSRLLDKDVQELDGFITSTPHEYASVLKGNYHYSAEQVWLTGLPRFDRLKDRSDKTITIMPTWRSYLFTGQNHKTGVWNLKNGFEHTRYTEFYRNLMNSSHLRLEAEKYGYKIQFKVHPTHHAHTDTFGFNDSVKIVPPEMSYADIYSHSSLIVTDYSSSIYDFIYLKKPVIYCQFDANEFFSGAHMYDKGNFDYERDGFGEVVYNLEDTIRLIVSYMESDCALRQPYKTRIESAFTSRHSDHCEQIYQKILSKGKY